MPLSSLHILLLVLDAISVLIRVAGCLVRHVAPQLYGTGPVWVAAIDVIACPLWDKLTFPDDSVPGDSTTPPTRPSHRLATPLFPIHIPRTLPNMGSHGYGDRGGAQAHAKLPEYPQLNNEASE